MTQKSLLYLKQKLTNDAGFTNPVLGNDWAHDNKQN